ncbi:hypothetical protein [Lichenicoccus sp.]|uniref:hypothetical protein n=1 Tax=Lichenicoccus sp. TaxID=2781899 RepID=UPI003D0A9241
MFRRSTSTPAVKTTPAASLASGKQAYEARRAAKAGVSLERWMADKQKRAQSELDSARKARVKAQAKPGLLRRLLERAHKPL